MRPSLLLPILLLCGLVSSHAQELTEEEQSAVTPYKTSFTPLPNFTYSPETSFVFGGFLMVQFKPDGAGAETQTSFSRHWASYSLNKQISIGTSGLYVAKGNRWMFDSYNEYLKWPEKYYGVGNDTSEEPLQMHSAQIESKHRLLLKTGKGWFMGAQLRYSGMMNVRFDPGDDLPMHILDDPAMIAPEGGHYLGFGASLRYDTRNSTITTLKGTYLEFSGMYYPSMASGSSFGNISWDLRKFWDLHSGKTVLALQLKGSAGFGSIPFRQLGLLGNSRELRGYYTGRFRDKHLAFTQAELRQHIYGRWGVVFFGGLGNVGSDFQDLFAANVKWNLGMGVRFNINKKDPLNIRVDYGRGRVGGAPYINVAEVF